MYERARLDRGVGLSITIPPDMKNRSMPPPGNMIACIYTEDPAQPQPQPQLTPMRSYDDEMCGPEAIH
jgi:hypothetical protein